MVNLGCNTANLLYLTVLEPLRILERLPVNFQESISISGWDFRFHWSMAGRGIPWQSRPMYPHIKRALPTTHHLYLFDTQSSLTCWHWDSLYIAIRSSSAQVADSRIPKPRASLESSPRTCIGQLGGELSSTYCTFIGIVNRSNHKQTAK